MPGYIQHNPRVTNGIEAVVGFFADAGPIDHEVKRLFAQGTLVVAHVHYRAWNKAGVDIFRVSGGKIVEHWDVLQAIPASTASGHDMFSQLG